MDYTKLISALTAYDRRTAKSEERRGIRVNIYRLSHLFKAAQQMNAEIIDGADPNQAFADNFTPTASNAGIAKRIGLAVIVDRGFWSMEKA